MKDYYRMKVELYKMDFFIRLTMRYSKLYLMNMPIGGESHRYDRFDLLMRVRLYSLSSIGKKCAYDLGILEEGVITVTNLVIDEKTDKDEEKILINKEAYSKQKESSFQKRRKGKQKKKKKKRVSRHPQVIEKTEEDFKVEHSKMLGKVHDEAQLHLKLIRQRLNNLVLERGASQSLRRKWRSAKSYFSQVKYTKRV